MTPERFRQIEEIYHAAREATGEERAALLARIDPELRGEVESLIAERTGVEFLEQPALRNAPELLEDATVTSVGVGVCLGPYRIEGKLGEGGMGEVFRAVDTRLGRAIAVKTTREQFSSRFEREARAISALNHPHICTLYDVGPNFLVMELVEGETLAARLKNGPLPIQAALLFASQIAAALAEAHGKGIIHRDLKPGNIMVGKSGIKVLDFGLARMGQDDTITASQMIVGTPAYMAPEQREGKPADARTDIYAFGFVLFEMLTGARVGTPQRKRIRPRKLERIVDRCLDEDPEKRWQSAAELQQALASVSPLHRGAFLAAAAAAILALAATGYFFLHRTAKLTAKDTVVLGDFENKTGDPVFDQTLRQGIAVQLEQSPFLSLVSEEQVQQALSLMKRPADTRLTSEVAREICERTGSAAVLEGSITSVGSQYILWLRARNCDSGKALAQEQAQVGNKEEVLKGMSRIAVQIRTRLGESLASIQQHSTPLEQATTSSLEALKAYSAGKVAHVHGATPAIPYFQRAIAIDPQFAMAHADLGFMWAGMGQIDRGAEEVRIAYGLLDRVGDHERRYIQMLYDRQVTGNLEKELQTLESWQQAYPRDPVPRGIIGGWVTHGTGQYERGIRASLESLELDPVIPFPYASLVTHNLFLDRFSQAEAALRVVAEHKAEYADFLIFHYYIAFLKGDQAGMDREVARGPGEHSADRMAHHQALVLARLGRMGQARVLWERAIAMAQQASLVETAAMYEAAIALCEAHFENAAAAREHARAALKLAKGRDVEYAAAYALALSGEVAESQRLAAGLEKRFPEDTPVQFEYLPTLQALSALARRAPQEGIARLEKAIPYDFAMPGTAFFSFRMFGGLYPAYVRGQAYLAAGRGKEAAVEFQIVLDHRGIVLADPIGALAHLQLGRAYLAAGDKAKAKGAYEEFLTLWKEADPDIPLLKRAGTEYAKL